MNGEEKRGFPLALLAGAVVVLVALGALYFLAQRPADPSRASAPLAMGEAEQAYVAKLRFENLEMHRAANFLGQEVTYLFGNIINDGDRPVREVEVAFVFRNLENEVVLRDTQTLFGPRAQPLAPGGSREIQVGWEVMPASWNQHVPEMRITGLLLD
jgi:hypothetical protein